MILKDILDLRSGSSSLPHSKASGVISLGFDVPYNGQYLVAAQAADRGANDAEDAADHAAIAVVAAHRLILDLTVDDAKVHEFNAISVDRVEPHLGLLDQGRLLLYLEPKVQSHRLE